jgi:HEAT repeat protein
MKMKLSITNLLIISFVLITPAVGTYGQEINELIDQLTGKTEAPKRDTQQLAQAYQKAIDYLLPLMSADDVRSRYNPQITFQDMGSCASRPGAETERRALAMVIIKTLEQAEMPNTVRNWFVLQIERIGKSESIPTLTKLLSSEDKHLRDYARRALEKNPDTAATDVLLKELTNAKENNWKIGLINSLGRRKAETAVKPIAQALNDSDIKISAAAVTALANIGGSDSITALMNVIEKPSPIYQKAAQGLIDIAHEMAKKDATGAAKIYEALYQNAAKSAENSDGPNPFNIRAAAVNGLIICDPERGASELVNIMKDSDPKTRSLAIQAARLSPSLEPVKALGKMLTTLDSYSQVQVLGVIGDRGDLSSINYVRELLQSDKESVRLATVNTMTHLGDTIAAESLFEIAIKGSGEEQQAALDGLAIMKGPNIEVLIKANALSGDVRSRVTAIELIGERHISDSIACLLVLAAEENQDISAAAFSALVNFTDSVDIETMVDLLSRAKSEKARNSGVTTLRSILAKTPDKESALKYIIDKMEKSESQIRLTLLGSLNALGGSAALKTVVEAAKSPDETTRDIGIRTLSNWPDYEATKILLEIASNPKTSLTHYVLATRGALQLIQNSESASLESRVSDCINAFDNARRDEERRQAISTMAFLPDAKVADKLLDLVKNKNFREEAALAAVQLASGMLRADRQAARNLAKKILEMNISEDINRRAESILSGRGFRFGGFRERGSRRRQR